MILHKNFTRFLLIFTKEGAILTPKRVKGGVEYAYHRSNHVLCTGDSVLQRLCTADQKLRAQTGFVYAFCDWQILKSGDRKGSNEATGCQPAFAFLDLFSNCILMKTL